MVYKFLVAVAEKMVKFYSVFSVLSSQAFLKGPLFVTAFKIHSNCTRCMSYKPEFSGYNGFQGNSICIPIYRWFLAGNRCVDGVLFIQKNSICICFVFLSETVPFFMWADTRVTYKLEYPSVLAQ